MVIKINEKDIRFGFGLYFLGRAIKNNNTDLAGLLIGISQNPISDVVDLMFFSAKIEAELDEVELDLTKREFITFLEENGEFNKEDGVIKKWSDKLTETVKGNFLPEIEKPKFPENRDEKKN